MSERGGVRAARVNALVRAAAPRLRWVVPALALAVAAGALTVRTDLFPYDLCHQTFGNVYEAGKLRQQWIFTRGGPPRTYFLGTTDGALAVVIVVASLLDFVRRQSHTIGRRVTVGGSVAVIAAGADRFAQRVFFPGGLT